jgi:hypothetical protein
MIQYTSSVLRTANALLRLPCSPAPTSGPHGTLVEVAQQAIVGKPSIAASSSCRAHGFAWDWIRLKGRTGTRDFQISGWFLNGIPTNDNQDGAGSVFEACQGIAIVQTIIGTIVAVFSTALGWLTGITTGLFHRGIANGLPAANVTQIFRGACQVASREGQESARNVFQTSNGVIRKAIVVFRRISNTARSLFTNCFTIIAIGSIAPKCIEVASRIEQVRGSFWNNRIGFGDNEGSAGGVREARDPILLQAVGSLVAPAARDSIARGFARSAIATIETTVLIQSHGSNRNIGIFHRL